MPSLIGRCWVGTMRICLAQQVSVGRSSGRCLANWVLLLDKMSMRRPHRPCAGAHCPRYQLLIQSVLPCIERSAWQVSCKPRPDPQSRSAGYPNLLCTQLGRFKIQSNFEQLYSIVMILEPSCWHPATHFTSFEDNAVGCCTCYRLC